MSKQNKRENFQRQHEIDKLRQDIYRMLWWDKYGSIVSLLLIIDILTACVFVSATSARELHPVNQAYAEQATTIITTEVEELLSLGTIVKLRTSAGQCSTTILSEVADEGNITTIDALGISHCKPDSNSNNTGTIQISGSELSIPVTDVDCKAYPKSEHGNDPITVCRMNVPTQYSEQLTPIEHSIIRPDIDLKVDDLVVTAGFPGVIVPFFELITNKGPARSFVSTGVVSSIEISPVANLGKVQIACDTSVASGGMSGGPTFLLSNGEIMLTSIVESKCSGNSGQISEDPLWSESINNNGSVDIPEDFWAWYDSVFDSNRNNPKE